MRSGFWKTWRKEVLHQLIQTNKWRFPQKNLKIGDIVILTDEDTPPAYWLLGRVESVKSNRSGLVGVYTPTVASYGQKGKLTYVLPVNKRIYLPVEGQATQAYFTLLEPLLTIGRHGS